MGIVNDITIKHYKKTVEGKKITFEIEFPSEITDESKATWLAIGIILQMTGICGTDYIEKPLTVHV